MTINVVYDISILGISYRDRKNFGISRTAETLLRALLESTDLSIVASSDLTLIVWLFSRLYLEQSDLGDRLPWLSNYSNTEIGNQIQQFFSSDVQSNFFLKTLKEKQFIKDQKIVEKLYGWINDFLKIQLQANSTHHFSDINIWHSPYYPAPDTIKQNKAIKSILTIHDLIPILHPEWCGMLGDEVKYFPPEFNLPKTLESINQDIWITCPSQSTKNDLCEYLGDRLDPEKVYVTPWAASNLFYPCHDLDKIKAVKEKYKIPEGKYILCLNTIEPRKNIDGLIRAFREAIKQGKIYDLSIVLAGSLGWQYNAIIREAQRFPRLAPRIIFTGYVADEDLAALYSGALVFVYPSFYEGFGLPPLEAMQCGIPVITSNNSSLPEVVGDAALLVNPRDEAEISDNILKVYQSAQLREDLAQKSLQQAKKYSWDICAQQHIAVYHQALNS